MKKNETFIGRRFGLLEVIECAPPSKDGHRRWVCKCECGKQTVVFGSNLTGGHTVSCGCGKSPDLTGKRFGNLKVLERSDKRGPRGKRTVPLWKCQCECGNITYKATDTLKNSDVSMCQACAEQYNVGRATGKAGFVAGTQIPKIKITKQESDNLSGIRGVYYDPQKRRYRARIKFKGKLYNLGSFANPEDAAKARRLGEEKYFKSFIESLGEEDGGGSYDKH